jgi:alkyldihydroxyacetonephosphate synthase
VEWHEREVGELGVRMLRAVKRELDPAGILNPGVLMRRT